MSSAHGGALIDEGGALGRFVRGADHASKGLLGSLLFFVFRVALVAIGQSLVHSAAPVVAYVVLAELLFAGYIQEGDTIIRHGFVFSSGVALGLFISGDWYGLAISLAAYILVTALRFRRRQ